jgi:uncharacterized protein YuzE
MDLTIQTDKEHDMVYFAFSRRALGRGAVTRTVRAGDDVALDFAGDGTLLGLEVMHASRVLGVGVDDVHLDALVGVKEAAARVGVQRSNFVRDYADKPDFPKPVAELATGRIWLRSQVEDYVRGRKRRAS